jgi:hypothetical protein
MQTYHYPSANGKLCVTPSFFISRRKLMQAMDKSYPVIETLSDNKIAKFKPKFKRA